MFRSIILGISIAVSASMVTLIAPVAGASHVVTARAVAVHQKGVNTFVPDSCTSDATWARWATNQVASVKALGANTIAYAFPFYTSSQTSNNFDAVTCETHPGSSKQTPSPDRMAALVDVAHTAGLRVFLRPILDETNLEYCKGCYRGTIHPSNTSLWFANYLNTLKPYLQMAQAHNVEHFAIATELNSLSKSASWLSLIASAKRYYTGDLVFTLLWASDKASTARSGTSNGLDSYMWALGMTPKSTPTQLLAQWNAALKRVPIVPALSTETLDEVGIPAQNGAYNAPWSWYLNPATYPFNQTIQQNWFTMACQFAKTHNMKGIYFWGPALYENGGILPTVPLPSEPANLQPAGQAAIKTCFTSVYP